MSQPKAVVIGYGFAGRCFHSYLIGLDSGLALHGVASRNPETRRRIEKERHCRAYDTFEAVLADPEVDIVVLATPNSTHADLAVQALAAGKHVVTDKIMATSGADCDRMIAAAKAHDRFLTVFQNRRWDGDFLTLQGLLDAGRLGELRWLEMAWQGFGAWGGWRGRPEMGGGRLFDLGAHMVDQVLLLMPGAVTSVYCRMHHDYDTAAVESHAMLVLGFADGATAVVDTGGMHALPKPRIQAFGTQGAYRIWGVDPQEKAMIEGHIDAAVESPERGGVFADSQAEEPVPTVAGRWRSFYENVAAVLRGSAQPAIRLPEVRRAMALFDAALDSARSGQVVSCSL